MFFYKYNQKIRMNQKQIKKGMKPKVDVSQMSQISESASKPCLRHTSKATKFRVWDSWRHLRQKPCRRLQQEAWKHKKWPKMVKEETPLVSVYLLQFPKHTHKQEWKTKNVSWGRRNRITKGCYKGNLFVEVWKANLIGRVAPSAIR